MGFKFQGTCINFFLDSQFKVIQNFTCFLLLCLRNGLEFFKQFCKNPFATLVMNPELLKILRCENRRILNFPE